MSTSAEQLKERVRLLQKELELKRRLLKKAERKSKSSRSDSINLPNGLSDCEQLFSSAQTIGAGLSVGAVDPSTSATFFCSQQSNLVTELRSCVLSSSALMQRKGVVHFRVLSLLSSDQHLKLYLLFPEVDRFQLAWSKRLNTNQVNLMRLITPSRGLNALFGLLLLEWFQFAQVYTLVFSLFVFKHLDDTVQLVDTVTVPYSIVQSRELDRKGMPVCDIHMGENSITSLVYVPQCVTYFIFNLFNSTESSLTLSLVNSVDATPYSVDLNPSWHSILRSVPGDDKLHSFFAVHSSPLRSIKFIGHWCSQDSSNSEVECNPFSIQAPDQLSQNSRHILASNFMPLRVESQPSQMLLSIVMSVSDTHVPSHVLVALVHVSDEVTCFVLRFCEINPPVEGPFDSLTLLCNLPFNDQCQQLLYVTTTVLGGRSYVNIFAWSLAHIFASSGAAPLQFSFQVPMDVVLFFLPLRNLNLMESFSELSKLVFVHDAQLKTYRILCQI